MVRIFEHLCIVAALQLAFVLAYFGFWFSSAELPRELVKPVQTAATEIAKSNTSPGELLANRIRAICTQSRDSAQHSSIGERWRNAVEESAYGTTGAKELAVAGNVLAARCPVQTNVDAMPATLGDLFRLSEPAPVLLVPRLDGLRRTLERPLFRSLGARLYVERVALDTAAGIGGRETAQVDFVVRFASHMAQARTERMDLVRHLLAEEGFEEIRPPGSATDVVLRAAGVHVDRLELERPKANWWGLSAPTSDAASDATANLWSSIDALVKELERRTRDNEPYSTKFDPSALRYVALTDVLERMRTRPEVSLVGVGVPGLMLGSVLPVAHVVSLFVGMLLAMLAERCARRASGAPIDEVMYFPWFGPASGIRRHACVSLYALIVIGPVLLLLWRADSTWLTSTALIGGIFAVVWIGFDVATRRRLWFNASQRPATAADDAHGAERHKEIPAARRPEGHRASEPRSTEATRSASPSPAKKRRRGPGASILLVSLCSLLIGCRISDRANEAMAVTIAELPALRSELTSMQRELEKLNGEIGRARADLTSAIGVLVLRDSGLGQWSFRLRYVLDGDEIVSASAAAAVHRVDPLTRWKLKFPEIVDVIDCSDANERAGATLRPEFCDGLLAYWHELDKNKEALATADDVVARIDARIARDPGFSCLAAKLEDREFFRGPHEQISDLDRLFVTGFMLHCEARGWLSIRIGLDGEFVELKDGIGVYVDRYTTSEGAVWESPPFDLEISSVAKVPLVAFVQSESTIPLKVIQRMRSLRPDNGVDRCNPIELMMDLHTVWRPDEPLSFSGEVWFSAMEGGFKRRIPIAFAESD